MKKALSFVLSVSLIFSAFCGIVSAETESISVVENEKKLQKAEPQKLMGGFVPDEPVQLDVHEGAPKRRSFAKSSPQQEVYEYLETQMKNHVQNIVLYPTYEVRAYYEYDEETHRTYTNIDEFHTLLRTVLFNNYDILAYDNPRNCTIVTDGSGNLYIETFSPQYFISAEDASAAVEMMDDEIENYLDAVRDIPSDDVIGKMVVIHDLICANNRYDTEGLNNENKYGISCNYARTAYNIFTNNMAVCQGYAIALKALYNALNDELMQERGTTENIIETSFCSSDKMAHIWNVVKVDGQWYHIDATWDDYDNYGSVGHNFFLRDDGYFMEDAEYHSAHVAFDGNNQPINDWVFYTDEQVVCGDDKYSQGYIFNIEYLYTISYSDGKYNVDLGDEYCFRTSSILLTKVLTTDSFLYEYKETEEDEGVVYNAVLYFTQQPIEIMQILTSFDENGALMANKCKIPGNRTIGEIYDFTMLFYNNSSPSRLFIWSPDNLEPLCGAVDLPAVVN